MHPFYEVNRLTQKGLADSGLKCEANAALGTRNFPLHGRCPLASQRQSEPCGSSNPRVRDRDERNNPPNRYKYICLTMTSDEELALIRTVLETTVKHDFVAPQKSVDPLQQREKQKMEATQTYILQQAFPTVQSLVPLYNAEAPSYTIRLDSTGSFLKPQPHMFITEGSAGIQVAEVKFKNHSYDTTIMYKDEGLGQKIALRNLQEQRFECLINGKPHSWHLLGPSKSVFELTEGVNRRVALFVYSEGLAQRTGSTSATQAPFGKQKIGELHMIDGSLREPIVLQQTLFSIVVVVEQAKRRATSIASWASPPPSKTHFPRRRKTRQEGAEQS